MLLCLLQTADLFLYEHKSISKIKIYKSFPILKCWLNWIMWYNKTEDCKIISQVILSAERSSGKFSDRVLLLGEGDQVNIVGNYCENEVKWVIVGYYKENQVMPLFHYQVGVGRSTRELRPDTNNAVFDSRVLSKHQVAPCLFLYYCMLIKQWKQIQFNPGSNDIYTRPHWSSTGGSSCYGTPGAATEASSTTFDWANRESRALPPRYTQRTFSGNQI